MGALQGMEHAIRYSLSYSPRSDFTGLFGTHPILVSLKVMQIGANTCANITFPLTCAFTLHASRCYRECSEHIRLYRAWHANADATLHLHLTGDLS